MRSKHTLPLSSIDNRALVNASRDHVVSNNESTLNVCLCADY